MRTLECLSQWYNLSQGLGGLVGTPTHQKNICNGDKCHNMDVNIHEAHREDRHKSSSKSTAQCSGLREGMIDILTLT